MKQLARLETTDRGLRLAPISGRSPKLWVPDRRCTGLRVGHDYVLLEQTHDTQPNSPRRGVAFWRVEHAPECRACVEEARERARRIVKAVEEKTDRRLPYTIFSTDAVAARAAEAALRGDTAAWERITLPAEFVEAGERAEFRARDARILADALVAGDISGYDYEYRIREFDALRKRFEREWLAMRRARNRVIDAKDAVSRVRTRFLDAWRERLERVRFARGEIAVWFELCSDGSVRVACKHPHREQIVVFDEDPESLPVPYSPAALGGVVHEGSMVGRDMTAAEQALLDRWMARMKRLADAYTARIQPRLRRYLARVEAVQERVLAQRRAAYRKARAAYLRAVHPEVRRLRREQRQHEELYAAYRHACEALGEEAKKMKEERQ